MAAAETPSDAAHFTLEGNLVVFEDKPGNAIHLATVVRRITNARMSGSVGKKEVRTERQRLYDALGLLRALQYDVKLYNEAMALNSAPDAETADARHARQSRVRVGTWRLLQQASSFGVRLPQADEGPVEVLGLDQLISTIESWYAEPIAHARRTVAEGAVDFDSLAELFTPGREVVEHGVATGVHGAPTGFLVRGCYYSRTKTLFGEGRTFYAALECAVAVGERFALIEHNHLVGEFAGTRPVRSGMDFKLLTAEARERLVARGRAYERVAQAPTLMEHTADAFTAVRPLSAAGQADVPARPVAGRMMVDTAAALRRSVHTGKGSGLASEAVSGVLGALAHHARAAAGRAGSAPSDGAAAADESTDESGVLLLRGPMPEAVVWRTWPTVAGFSFAVKRWGIALVDGLSDVHFNRQAFEQLVLPPGRKRLIEALVVHSADPDGGGSAAGGGADLISGKGEGSIFLLHGPPGVGKTLTAEAIAELLGRPLYVVSMGELGTTPEALEKALSEVFALCAPWRALVLIDEAEMLLERRAKEALVRNAMVCVMLRLLEYYAGVLFLTSNRVESLDPAFQSRVQCALRYEPLDQAGRAQVWRNLLGRAGADEGAVDVGALARHELNGRQIKNALQLALALARRDGVPVARRHLDETVAITLDFVQAVTAP